MTYIPEEYLISDEEIQEAWGNANFGSLDRRTVILDTLLKIAGDFSTGRTASEICKDLGLLTKSGNLTKKGRRVMYFWNENRYAMGCTMVATPAPDSTEGEK